MRQLLQHLADGKSEIVAVPAPGPARGALLIRTSRSLISAGTERMLVDFGKAGWIGKARQQPEKVRAVLAKIRANGIAETVRAVRAKLRQPIAVGYCQVGEVIDTGEADWIAPGDRAISNGPHAEVVSVVHDLCARIPAGVSDEAASFTPLGAIALQGINLLDAKPGDKVVVTGLGLIGQIAVRILRTMGCEVLGLDPSAERRELTEKSGATTADGDPVAAALSWTDGRGVAGVLITASTPSNDVVNQSARSCRRRGKVVLIGVVGLQLNRTDFYRNEVSFQVSCSYGARNARDSSSARANFEQILTWMSAGKLAVEDLISHRYDFASAAQAYATLGDRRALGVMLKYDSDPANSLRRTVEVTVGSGAGRHPKVALVGAGNFAARTLVPEMLRLSAPPAISTVASRQGASALLLARSAGAKCATTDTASVWSDAETDAVFITTRHDSHAQHALAALQAGKHVWVEKPLCLTLDELSSIEGVISSWLLVDGAGATKNQERPTNNTGPAKPVLMVGFNRRFAPMAVALRQALAARRGPHRFTITVNAGRLDPDHWTLDLRAGGGRIVGEGCHFVDLLRYLAAAPITDVRCIRRDTDGQDGGAFELNFANGATGLIDYRTDLPAHLPKETIEVSGAGYSAQIVNWSRLTSQGLGGLRQGWFWTRAPHKGHPEALAAFLQAVQGGPAPIPSDEIVEVSRWCIAMQGMRGAS